MVCGKCGNQNSDGVRFCSRCGNALVESGLESSQQSADKSSNLVQNYSKNINSSSENINDNSNIISFDGSNNVTNNNLAGSSNVNQEMSSNNTNNTNNTNNLTGGNTTTNNLNSDPKLKFLLIGGGLLLVITVVVIYTVSKIGVNNSSKSVGKNNATSFFIKNKESKYALFNIDGQKLTDFSYSEVSDFIGDSAIVYQDDDVGIISSRGKMYVSFGKYKAINRAGSLFEVYRKDYKRILINEKGKSLYNLEDIGLHSYYGVDGYVILENEKSKKYTILDAQGKSIFSFPLLDDADEPKISEKNGITSIFYNKKNYVLNINNGREIVSFDAVDQFCITGIFNDEKSILLSSCGSFLKGPTEYSDKVIENSKVIDLDNECDDVTIEQDKLLCNVEGTNYYLNDDYKKIGGYYSTAYDSNFNYVYEDLGTFKGVDFYNNGKIVKNDPCRTIGEKGYMSNGLFILRTSRSRCDTKYGNYDFFKANGERAFTKTFESASKFDKNGYSIVSEDNKNYYLLNSKGEQVSNNYDKIYNANYSDPEFDSDYYIVSKNDNKGILDKNGKEVLSCEYSTISIEKRINKTYALLTKSDSSVTVYNLESKKEIITSKESLNLRNDYIESIDGNKRKLYSYTTGKLFYEE